MKWCPRNRGIFIALCLRYTDINQASKRHICLLQQFAQCFCCEWHVTAQKPQIDTVHEKHISWWRSVVRKNQGLYTGSQRVVYCKLFLVAINQEKFWIIDSTEHTPMQLIDSMFLDAVVIYRVRNPESVHPLAGCSHLFTCAACRNCPTKSATDRQKVNA